MNRMWKSKRVQAPTTAASIETAIIIPVAMFRVKGTAKGTWAGREKHVGSGRTATVEFAMTKRNAMSSSPVSTALLTKSAIKPTSAHGFITPKTTKSLLARNGLKSMKCVFIPLHISVDWDWNAFPIKCTIQALVCLIFQCQADTCTTKWPRRRWSLEQMSKCANMAS